MKTTMLPAKMATPIAVHSILSGEAVRVQWEPEPGNTRIAACDPPEDYFSPGYNPLPLASAFAALLPREGTVIITTES